MWTWVDDSEDGAHIYTYLLNALTFIDTVSYTLTTSLLIFVTKLLFRCFDCPIGDALIYHFVTIALNICSFLWLITQKKKKKLENTDSDFFFSEIKLFPPLVETKVSSKSIALHHASKQWSQIIEHGHMVQCNRFGINSCFHRRWK